MKQQQEKRQQRKGGKIVADFAVNVQVVVEVLPARAEPKEEPRRKLTREQADQLNDEEREVLKALEHGRKTGVLASPEAKNKRRSVRNLTVDARMGKTSFEEALQGLAAVHEHLVADLSASLPTDVPAIPPPSYEEAMRDMA